MKNTPKRPNTQKLKCNKNESTTNLKSDLSLKYNVVIDQANLVKIVFTTSKIHSFLKQ